MTIEKSPPSTEAKPAASSEAKGAKSKSGKADESSQPGGFMAILATLDTEAAPSAALEDAAAFSLGPSSAAVASQVPSTADASCTTTVMDAAALLAQAAQLQPAVPSDTLHATPGQTPVPTEGTLAPALNPFARPAKGLPDAATAPSAPIQVSEGPVAGPRKPIKTQPDFAAMAQLAADAAPANSATPVAVADARTAQMAAKAEAVLSATVAPPALLAAVANAVRREDEGRERSVFKVSAPEGGPAAAAVSSPTGLPSTSVVNATAAASPAELYVAEQVKYWISNDVKNAEMRLDGIGNNPVEVSISMQGNEAHVAFRSDEAQARTVLEAASSHLKDLLQREGLVLSGVSVGTTGLGNAGSQQRREQQGNRQGREVGAAQSVVAQGAAMGQRASGRALDLFV
jgi:flagellar hook-length control protein FliK